MAGLGSEGGGTVYLTAYSEGLLRADMDHKPDLAPARIHGGQRPQAQGSLRNVGIKAINMRLVHVRNH